MELGLKYCANPKCLTLDVVYVLFCDHKLDLGGSLELLEFDKIFYRVFLYFLFMYYFMQYKY